jgi:hypothetical protein
LEDGISQKFKPFVILLGRNGFLGKGAVGKRLENEPGIRKTMAEPLFKLLDRTG